MWFVLKIRLLGDSFVIKVIKCEQNNFTKSTNLMKIVSLPHRMTWWYFLGGLLNTVFLLLSARESETQGHFHCPITHCTGNALLKWF